MMRSCFLVVAVLTACVYAADGDYVRPLQGMQGLSIICDNEAKLSLVKSYSSHPKFDFLRITRVLGAEIKVLVTADAVSQFKSVLSNHGIEYTVFDENVAENVVRDHVANDLARQTAYPSEAPLTYYPRLSEIETYLKELEANNDFVTLIDIGKSYEGRTMYALKISSGPGNKPAILMDAGIHAREWIAPTTALYTINQLVANKTNSALFQNVDWYIITNLNPDGYEYSHTNNRMWRKTRSPNAGSHCVGTDPNRNFDFEWMTAGASSNPCAEDYAGAKPFSEPETRNLRDFVLPLKGTIKLYITIHSYGQYLLHPWGYTAAMPENEPQLRSLADKAHAALRSVHGTKYTVGSSTIVLYEAAGGSDDWLMAIGGAPLSYTIELPGGGSYGFNPPPKNIDPVGKETFEAFRVFAEYVDETYAQV